MTEDRSSLSHTRWNCKYHIVFAPKFRRQAIYGKLKIDIGRILRILSERKRVIIEEADCVQIIYSYVGEYPPEFEFDKLGKLKALSLEITLDVDQYVVS